MPAGRPLKFTSVEELEAKIAQYFIDCDPHVGEKQVISMVRPKDLPMYQDVSTEKYITDQKPYTVTGLAVFLDCDRDTLLNYQDKEEYFGTIKRAKDKIHAYAEQELFVGRNQTGTIFNLKNNWNWVDKTEVESKVDQKLELTNEQYQRIIKSASDRIGIEDGSAERSN